MDEHGLHEHGAHAPTKRAVAVFDVHLSPAVAFMRSLGALGVPIVAYSNGRSAGGRYSKYVTERRWCPPRSGSEEFVTWLTGAIDHDIDLIAPTSDLLVFSAGEAMDRLQRSTTEVGLPPASGLRTCLFKGRFADALASLGFPTPPAAIPASLPEAIAAADRIGYPLVIKPRSHVGIGSHRGVSVSSRRELEATYRRYDIPTGQAAALRHVPQLALPILQKYFDPGTVDVISLTGCLDQDGTVLALGAARKVRQLPRRFGVGTLFEPVDLPSFAAEGVRVVRSVLEQGIFELEVLVDPAGHHYAIDLNPRGFGQIALDIARGRDLPRLWYESVSGEQLPTAATRNVPPMYWQDAVPLYAESFVRLMRGPRRRTIIDQEMRRLRLPKVDAVFSRRDPVPGVLIGLGHLRHPRAFLRRLLTDVEGSASRK